MYTHTHTLMNIILAISTCRIFLSTQTQCLELMSPPQTDCDFSV